MIQLSLRLEAIFHLIEPSQRLIDVGSDHGFIIGKALETQKVPHAIATDIHALPALRTKNFLKQHNLLSKAQVYHGDGLLDIHLKPLDTVVLAGMGGLEIIKILLQYKQNTASAFPPSVCFILQPQRSLEEVRNFLYTECLAISQEILIWDRDKLYVAIKALSLPPEKKDKVDTSTKKSKEVVQRELIGDKLERAKIYLQECGIKEVEKYTLDDFLKLFSQNDTLPEHFFSLQQWSIHYTLHLIGLDLLLSRSEFFHLFLQKTEKKVIFQSRGNNNLNLVLENIRLISGKNS